MEGETVRNVQDEKRGLEQKKKKDGRGAGGIMDVSRERGKQAQGRTISANRGRAARNADESV